METSRHDPLASRLSHSENATQQIPPNLAPFWQSLNSGALAFRSDQSNNIERVIPPSSPSPSPSSNPLIELAISSFHSVSEYQSGSLGSTSPESRVVFINDPKQTKENYGIAGNKIQTSKYSLLSFLPLNLFEQFHRLAYIYFLAIIALNQIPQLAVFGRTASLFPLLFVLIITAIKDGYEDWRRHRSDEKENSRLAMVFQDGELKPKKWKYVKVGEVIKVGANETIPCDIVLLSTSNENGSAYVQTINLDGETNLKTRYARPETIAKYPELNPISGMIVCRKPERNIYEFTAYIEVEKHQQLPLGPTNIILRGCELKNTCWAVGVAVYTGQETKAMLNSSGAQSKRSRLEKNMNRETLWLSVFLAVICLVGGFGTGVWINKYQIYLHIIPFYHNAAFSPQTEVETYSYYGLVLESIFAFLSFVITFQVMIPISLYISMEIVRLGQSYFMIRDLKLFHSESDSRFQCRALNINEDLGQIKYIFSDKTGTLTENKMEFWAASINGVNYSEAKVSTELVGDGEGSIKLEGKHFIEDGSGKRKWKPKNGVKVDPRLVQILQQDLSDSAERKAVHNYLLTLAACNTVVPTKVNLTPSGSLQMEAAQTADEGIGLLEYQGESPDEQALVSAAASYGYTLLERTSNEIVVDILGEIQRYQILGIHEFDSTRKCMSMVIECPNKAVKVLVKGADSSVLNKLAVSEGNIWLREITDGHLGSFAREGLRTLVIAERDLSEGALKDWKKRYAKASTALLDRASLLQESAGLVERDLRLLGATGIEDKLQEGVPETIAALREAGMKVWVLTGDKQETAVSIGFSCALLTDEMELIIINTTNRQSCQEELLMYRKMYMTDVERKGRLEQNSVGALDDMQRTEQSSESISHAIAIVSKEGTETQAVDRGNALKSLALVIDGSSLVYALQDDLQQDLYDLASVCKVVLCCRVAPFQKAGIVSLVKRKTSEMTLAIGDGANDVSMIQMADVGVGISGQEGRQAVMASDFAMGQFKFLKQLLLVHGHWNYSRLCYMVLYNFYRNAVFVMLLFWYIFYTAFSPSSAITDWSRMFFSLIYTSVPTIIVGIFDKDVSVRTLLKYPSLYCGGQRGESYSSKLFWVTMVDTLWQSLVIFFVPYLSYVNTTIDIWSLGSIWTITVVVVANLHLAMDVQLWNWITHASIWGSILATYASLFLLDSMASSDELLTNYWTIYNVIQTSEYWLIILLTVGLSLAPHLIVKVANQHFWPSDIQIAREEEKITTVHQK